MKLLARVLLYLAATSIVVGVALISIPAALIVGGIELGTIALFGLEVSDEPVSIPPPD